MKELLEKLEKLNENEIFVIKLCIMENVDDLKIGEDNKTISGLSEDISEVINSLRKNKTKEFEVYRKHYGKEEIEVSEFLDDLIDNRDSYLSEDGKYCFEEVEKLFLQFPEYYKKNEN